MLRNGGDIYIVNNTKFIRILSMGPINDSLGLVHQPAGGVLALASTIARRRT